MTEHDTKTLALADAMARHDVRRVLTAETVGWHSANEDYAVAREALVAHLGAAPETHDELGRDPDGEISLDWQNKGGDMLSMSIAPDGRLAWALHRRGTTGGRGTVQLSAFAYSVLNDVLNESAPPSTGAATETTK
jgi:hypothetical protein